MKKDPRSSIIDDIFYTKSIDCHWVAEALTEYAPFYYP